MGLERIDGIEPTTKGWKPLVLPLNYIRIKMMGLTRRGSGGGLSDAHYTDHSMTLFICQQAH